MIFFFASNQLPAPSVSELASQLLEKVSCIPSARLVDLSHWEETVNAALARSGAGLEIPAESHSAMWSTARAHELLAWCRHTPSPLPDRVASWLLYYYDQGFLSMSDVMTHSEESSNGGDHSNSNTNASVSYCLKDAQQLVQEYALLQRNWRGRIAKEVRVLPQISSGFSGSVRDGCSGSAAGAARCHWATQWLDALSATTVANIQRIDALLPKRSASRARRALAEMRGAVSSCLMVNSTQRALVEHGVVPTQPRLYQWLCAYVLHLSSVEAAVRVGYVELATHSLCCFEASLFPVVAYLQAVEDVVRDIAHAGGEVLSEDNVVDAVKECIGVV